MKIKKRWICTKLESSQSLHTSPKAVLFARWQHHLRFGCGFPHAPSKAMVTKISKWSRIQDSFRITSKIESLVVFAIPNIPRKFQKDPYITFWVILLTHRQTNRQTKSGKNITSLAEVISFWINTCQLVKLRCAFEAYHEAISILQHYVSYMKTSKEVVDITLSYLIIKSANIHFTTRHLYLQQYKHAKCSRPYSIVIISTWTRHNHEQYQITSTITRWFPHFLVCIFSSEIGLLMVYRSWKHNWAWNCQSG